ncbi:MAG: VOC family protein [Candidatus Delongbacteria bacterium]|nr:VOC family protein [Candidatus Delongbacteria bacterium]MBN2836041.1 VOC family protein [Candidatus Delongbacteria bacterium]
MKNKLNPVVYFEIPVSNMERAIKFYESIFDFTFELGEIDNIEMAFFPYDSNNFGITGALAKGEIYKPTKEGVLLYFNTENIDNLLDKVSKNGGRTLYPKTSVGEYGFVAEFEDSEGNRIAIKEELD